MRMMIAALAMCVVGLPATTAHAQSATTLSAAELDGQRGGFIVAAGVTLNFGAVVRTYIGGELALESRLTWTEQGAVTNRTLGDIPGLMDLSTALDSALAGGLDLSGLQNGQGVLLSDADGATALIQSLQGGIQNLVVNNADGREFRQEVEITLTLPDLSTMQRSYSMERLGSQIGSDINAGLIRSLGQ